VPMPPMPPVTYAIFWLIGVSPVVDLNRDQARC
jgi:hypothetical protein